MTEAEEGTGEAADSGRRGLARSPWVRALVAVAALAIAHVGLGLFLTRSARGAVHEIEAGWTTEELSSAKRPGPQPERSGEEWQRWHRSQRLWDDAQTWTERRHQLSVYTIALTASFVVMAGFVTWLALSAHAAARRA